MTDPAPENRSDADSDEPRSFEESLEDLERITHQVESGTLPLERALEEFERGVALARRCREELDRAEGRIQQVMEDGSLTAFASEDAGLSDRD